MFTTEEPELPPLPDSPYPDMDDIQVTVQGVEKLLQNLQTNKSARSDEIPNTALKSAASEIAPVLLFIFQQSLDTGDLPEDWNQAIISPIFKKGSKLDINNYRPISLTCVSCKILEHIIDSVIMKHHSKHHILGRCSTCI